ncbi:MAG: hypothetical protein R2813_13945 [Flavobacteriales bacterium]
MTTYLLYATAELNSALEEISENNGRVTIVCACTANIFIALLPSSFNVNTLQHSVTSKENLDSISRQYKSAADFAFFDIRGSEEEDIDLETNDLRVANDDSKLKAPNPFIDYSTVMKGTVAVGLLSVGSSYAGGTYINTVDQKNILSQSMLGLYKLATASSFSEVTFYLDYRSVAINAHPEGNPITDDQWRDPALVKLGYSAGGEGIYQYNAYLASSLGTDWAITVFFEAWPYTDLAWVTKFGPLNRYAAANYSQLSLLRQDNDLIPAYLGREICMLFGAQREDAGCSCDSSGYFEIPNNNCATCVPPGRQSFCIMASPFETWLGLCNWTQAQIGWSFNAYQAAFSGVSTIRMASGTVVMAFSAHNEGRSLLLSTSEDGMSWSTNIDTNHSSYLNASLSEFSDRLYIAFRNRTENTINLMNASPEQLHNWSNPMMIENTAADSSPALEVYNSQALWCAYTMWDSGSRNLYYRTSNDGSGWSDKIKVGFSSLVEPSLLWFNNTMFMSYLEPITNGPSEVHGKVAIVHYDVTNESWTGRKYIGNNLSRYGVAMTEFNGKLYMAYVLSNDGNETLVFNYYDPQTGSWSRHKEVFEICSLAPSLFVKNNLLFLTFTKLNGQIASKIIAST